MIRLYEPSLALFESMYNMFFAPLICCSIGAAMDCVTTFAFAPGNVVATCTCGGTICGYCDTGSPVHASAPASVMMSDRTVEKIGRSMKKLNMLFPRRCGRRRLRCGIRRRRVCLRRSKHGLH